MIGACPRSGTTLLRRILDTHPDIACGPESNLFLPGRPDPARLALGYGLPEAEIRGLLAASDSQGGFIDAFMRRYVESVGTRRWAEKTPLNVRHIPFVFEHFPEARFIHVIRDGRDTVCSMRTHPERRLVDGQWVREERTLPLEPLIRRWDRDVRLGRSFRKDPRYSEVRYEDLVRQPRETLERLFRFISEPFDEGVLSHRAGTERAREDADDKRATIHDRSIGRWRTDLTPEEQALFRRIAGPLLVELKYASGDDW